MPFETTEVADWSTSLASNHLVLNCVIMGLNLVLDNESDALKDCFDIPLPVNVKRRKRLMPQSQYMQKKET